MSTLPVTNNAEFGIHADAVTTGNSGPGGTAFDEVNISGSGAVLIDDTVVSTGTRSFKHVSTGSNGTHYPAYTYTATTEQYGRFNFRMPSRTYQPTIMRNRNSAPATCLGARFVQTTSKYKLEMRDGAATQATIAALTPPDLEINHWYRFEWHATGLGTDTGVVEIRLFDDVDVTTPWFEASATGVDLRGAGTASAGVVRTEIGGIASLIGTVYTDEWGIRATGGWWGPATPNDPPTLELDKTHVRAWYGETTRITATAANPEGGDVEIEWTVPETPAGANVELTPVGANAVDVRPIAGPDGGKLGSYVVLCTVTDDTDKTATAHCVIDVASKYFENVRGTAFPVPVPT